MAPSTREPARTTISVTRARQGRTGLHVFWVLLFGTLLAALALFAAWAWRSDDFASANVDNGRSKPETQLFNAPEPAAINPTPEQKQRTPTNPGPAT